MTASRGHKRSCTVLVERRRWTAQRDCADRQRGGTARRLGPRLHIPGRPVPASVWQTVASRAFMLVSGWRSTWFRAPPSCHRGVTTQLEAVGNHTLASHTSTGVASRPHMPARCAPAHWPAAACQPLMSTPCASATGFHAASDTIEVRPHSSKPLATVRHALVVTPPPPFLPSLISLVVFLSQHRAILTSDSLEVV